MQEVNPMDEDPEKVANIKAKLQHGKYEIDPVAVADAVLRRLRAHADARAQLLQSGLAAPPNGRLRADARTRTAARLRP
jgi:hypothetical protein